MSQPLAYQIISALQTRLQAISPSGGYNTDAGDRVHLGRRRVNPDELDIGPVLNVYDVSDEVDEATAYGDEACHVRLRVNVDAFCRDFDGEGVLLAHLVAQDVFNSLLTTDRTLSGLVLDLGYSGRTIEYPEPGGDTVSVSLEFSTLYLMPYGNT